MKEVKLGALNFLTKSHEIEKNPERRYISIVWDHKLVSILKETMCYKDFDHFDNVVRPLKLYR